VERKDSSVLAGRRRERRDPSSSRSLIIDEDELPYQEKGSIDNEASIEVVEPTVSTREEY